MGRGRAAWSLGQSGGEVELGRDFGHRGGATQAALHLSRRPLCLTHHPQGGGCVFSKPMFSLMNPLLAFYKLQNSQRGETEAASEGHRIPNMLPPWHLVL